MTPNATAISERRAGARGNERRFDEGRITGALVVALFEPPPHEA